MGTTSYVLFGNREYLDDADPVPRPAVTNAADLRTIFSKMDFVKRIKDVRYRGECPRLFEKEEQLLLNSYFLRFSQRGRNKGLTIVTPCGSAPASKYYPKAPEEKRCFEWLVDAAKNARLHLSLHDIKEDWDLWTNLRQVSGFEDLKAARKLTQEAARKAEALEEKNMTPIWIGGQAVASSLGNEEKLLITGTFIRWSEKARQAGLLATTELKAIEPHYAGNSTAHQIVKWRLKIRTTTTTEKPAEETEARTDEELVLSTQDLVESQDIMTWFRMLSRMADQTVAHEEEKDADPWQDSTWNKHMGEMWRRVWKPKRRPQERPLKPADEPTKPAEDVKTEAPEQAEEEGVEGEYGWEYEDKKRKANEPTAKRFAKEEQEEVWARFADGEYYRALVEVEHADGKLEVAWENGHKGDNVFEEGYGERVVRVREHPKNPSEILQVCQTCQNTGLFLAEDGMELFCQWCRYGQLAEQEMAAAELEQQRQQPQEAWDAWIRVLMEGSTSVYMYKNIDTGELTTELPPILQQSWEKRMLNDRVVYQNLETGEFQTELPPITYDGANDGQIQNTALDAVKRRVDALARKSQRVSLTASEEAEVEELTKHINEFTSLAA